MKDPVIQAASTQCLACGEGKLVAHTEHNPVEVNGQTVSLPLHYSVCDHCGAELTSASQAQANKRAMVAAEKQTLGLLAGASIRSFRQQYKITQIQAAQLFGGGKVGFSRYENDDIVQSQAMDSLLRLCIEHPYNLIRLARTRQVELDGVTRQGIHSDIQRETLAIAPIVQKILGDAMAHERKTQSAPASNEKFEVTERSVWKVAA